MCITCHTTQFKKNYDAKSDTFQSTWLEINVSCQSCHGPGEKHVKWAETHSHQSSERLLSYHDVGLLVDFKKNDANEIVETCAICHSRRSELMPGGGAGEPLMDHYLPALLNEGLYYPDGQQQAEVYVYNSFRQSKMYQMGVSCIDCHHPHTGKLKFPGNAVCTQCHQPEGNKKYPSAAKLYDDFSHHHHQMGTQGAQCVSCHMPASQYMIIHARPDHNIQIPRPDLSVKFATPNACTNCHTDKSAKWAADIITKWYGPNRHTRVHASDAIAEGRAGKVEALEKLIQLANNHHEPTVLRATGLDILSRYGLEGVKASIAGTHDSDPAVRRAALTGLEKLPAKERLLHVLPLLSDPILAVRIEAARVLSPIPIHLFNESGELAFKKAYAELITSWQTSLDMPSSHLHLGAINENTGNAKNAEQYYLHALQLDPDFLPARLNLARFYSTIKRYDDALKILREGLKRVPNQGELQYSLGLLLTEENHLEDAVYAFEKAVTLLPHRMRIRYNYALALQQIGQMNKAEQVLLRGEKLAPDDSSIIYALTILYVHNKDWNKAMKWANKLQQLNPSDAQISQLVEKIKVYVANSP